MTFKYFLCQRCPAYPFMFHIQLRVLHLRQQQRGEASRWQEVEEQTEGLTFELHPHQWFRGKKAEQHMPTDNKYPAGRHATWHKPTPRPVRTNPYPLAVRRLSLCTVVTVACKRTSCKDTQTCTCSYLHKPDPSLSPQLNSDVNRLDLMVAEVSLHFQKWKIKLCRVI